MSSGVNRSHLPAQVNNRIDYWGPRLQYDRINTDTNPEEGDNPTFDTILVSFDSHIYSFDSSGE